MSATKWAYLAGLFDSDGCVHIAREIPSGGSIRHPLKVVFSQNDEGFLQGLRHLVGAGAVQDQRSEYSLILSSSAGEALLQRLVPYLCIKREEAELAVEFRAETAWRMGVRLPEVIIQKRDEYRDALFALKSSRQPVLPCLVPSGPLTDAECAYLAGFVDGDGCISITRHNRKDTPTPAYDLWLVMVQGEGEAFFQYWQKRTGLGSVFRIREAGSKCKIGGRYIECKQDVYQWRLSSRAAEGLLSQVADFLRLKKEQAEIALQFRSTFAPQGGRGRRPGGHDSCILSHIVEERERCRLRLSEMNGR